MTLDKLCCTVALHFSASAPSKLSELFVSLVYFSLVYHLQALCYSSTEQTFWFIVSVLDMIKVSYPHSSNQTISLLRPMTMRGQITQNV